MANAVTTAPEKKRAEIEIDGEKVFEGSKEHEALLMTFDADKKYVIQLAQENPDRELPIMEVIGLRSFLAPKQRFKPQQNLVYTSQIIWKGQRRMLRYYDGCDTIFADKQPKDKESIDQFIKSTPRRDFLEGKFMCFGYERMLLLYLNICSWNAKSKFRTRIANEIFIPVNGDETASLESSKLDEIETALSLAKEASMNKMLIHLNYLEIPTMDYDSGNDLTEPQLRTEYRKYAIKNPSNFVKSYGDKKIEIKYYINKALEKGLINNKGNQNRASWQNGGEICDISGIRTTEGIAQKLFEFSQLDTGEEFLIQLKALFE